MTDRPGLDFSFSGLKTALITAWRKQMELNHDDAALAKVRADLAASFQSAIVDTLRIKCLRALQAEGLNLLVVSGGVSANQHLRQDFGEKLIGKKIAGQALRISYPSLQFCTDNAAMIALAGTLRLQAGESSPNSVDIRPRWPLSDLARPGLGQ